MVSRHEAIQHRYHESRERKCWVERVKQGGGERIGEMRSVRQGNLNEAGMTRHTEIHCLSFLPELDGKTPPLKTTHTSNFHPDD